MKPETFVEYIARNYDNFYEFGWQSKANWEVVAQGVLDSALRGHLTENVGMDDN